MLHGASRPVVGVLAGEGVDVDHPQPDAAVVVELVDGALHLGEPGRVEHAGVVGDVVGQPQRRLGRPSGRWATSSSHGQHREQQAEQAGTRRLLRMIANVVVGTAAGTARPANGPGRLCVGEHDRSDRYDDFDRRAPGGRGAEGCGAARHRHRAPHRLRPGPGPGAALRGAAPAGRQDAGRRPAARATPRAPG